MKKSSLILLVLWVACGRFGYALDYVAEKPITDQEEQRLQDEYAGYRGVDPGYHHAGEAAVERWMDWKFGLRIHWGLYSQFGDPSASWIIRKHTGDKEWLKNYFASYQTFNPVNFNADQWMNMMQRGGMKYFSFTTKHHEGFCLWDTQTVQRGFRKKPDGTFEEVTNHFSIMETPYKHDIVAELVKAGRAHGLGVSLYYSHIDWHDWFFGWDKLNYWYDPTFTAQSDPARWAGFIQQEKTQVTELLTKYGPIDTLCLDIHWPKSAQADADDVAKLARKLQPTVMLRNRGIEGYGDYETPEKVIPANLQEMNRPWQVIYPGASDFAYAPDDTYKPKEWGLATLIDVVSKGGNFQIAFGPDPSGKWPQETIDHIGYIGDWLKVNGESIYATRAYLRYHDGEDIRFTRSKDKKYVYIISLKWPGATIQTKLVQAVKGSTIRMLGVNRDLAWHQDKEGLTIELPKDLQDPAKRPCVQAYAFKVESKPWEEFAASLPPEQPPPVPIKTK